MRHSALRERLKYQASPLSMVVRSASSFMCATISTSPLAASVATQVTSPTASNLGWNASPPQRSLMMPLMWTRSPRENHARGISAAPLAPWTGSAPAPPVVAEHAGKPAGEGHRAVLGDAAHRHAGMLRLDHHRNAARFEDLVDRGCDLGGQMLLGLQAPGKDVGQPRQLGQADHPLDRRIGDVRLAGRTASCDARTASRTDVAHQHEIVIAARSPRRCGRAPRPALMVARYSSS